MWPMPRAPISATRKRVVGVTRQTVRGTPISPLSELTGATVSATDSSTAASRSLVEVLPELPVMPTIAQLGGPVDDAARDGTEGGLHVVDDDLRHALDRARGERGDGAGGHRRVDVGVAVGVLADPGHVEAARGDVAGVGRDDPVDDDVVGGRRCPRRDRP